MQERRKNRHLILFGFVEIFQKDKTKPPILLYCDRIHQSEQGCGCGIRTSPERSTPHKAERPGAQDTVRKQKPENTSWKSKPESPSPKNRKSSAAGTVGSALVFTILRNAYLLSMNINVCVCVYTCKSHKCVHAEIKEQFVGVSFLFAWFILLFFMGGEGQSFSV